jgi:hypothetical protein
VTTAFDRPTIEIAPERLSVQPGETAAYTVRLAGFPQDGGGINFRVVDTSAIPRFGARELVGTDTVLPVNVAEWVFGVVVPPDTPRGAYQLQAQAQWIAWGSQGVLVVDHCWLGVGVVWPSFPFPWKNITLAIKAL